MLSIMRTLIFCKVPCLLISNENRKSYEVQFSRGSHCCKKKRIGQSIQAKEHESKAR